MKTRLFAIVLAILGLAIGLAQLVAQTDNRPNILFCIADDASYPHMGAYGTGWVKTPAFDRVAKEGILFTNAYTPNAKCAPSRACILTGRNSWQLKAAGNHQPFFPPEFRTYAEALAQHGYFVAKTAKGWAPGIAVDKNGKPRHLAGTPFDKRKTKPPATGISNADYAANFEDFLKAKPEGKPWCFWYGGHEPHRRYEYGSGIAKGGKKLTDIDKVPKYWPDSEVIRTDMLDYAFEIEYFDQHLAKMLRDLEDRGELDNTLVVVTGDNGMPFPRVKGQEYERSNHLPLAIMWKNGLKNPGRVVNDYVSFIDFAPTFVELARVDWDATGMKPSPGRSLTDILYSTKSGRVNAKRDHVLIGKERHDIGRPHDWGYPIRGIVNDGMLYLRNFEPARWPAGNPETGYLNCDGSPTKTQVLESRSAQPPAPYWRLAFGKRPEEEMYDVKNDPGCMRNLAGNPEYAARESALEQRLMDELKRQQDPRMFGNGHVFDNYPVAFPAQRNFYERFLRGEVKTAGWINGSDVQKAPLPAGNVTLKLWPHGAPGETGKIGPERRVPPKEGQKKVIRLTDVSQPTITLYRPPKGKANGVAVLVAPGGGYNILAWDLEGTEIAQWLNSIGVTAVILKYRVPRRDKENPHEAPLQDAQRAMRLVRHNAKAWGIDPARLGMIGFSAGAHLTVMTGTHWDETTHDRVDAADDLSSRPDFMIPIYAAFLVDKQDPMKLNPLVRITEKTPPTFMAVAYNDKDRGAQAALLLIELKKKGVPAELHVFLKGGHGYGLRPSEDPVSGWPKLCEQWMRASGLLPVSGTGQETAK